MAIGVGVAAVVVAAAVFIGPSVVECAQDEAGFGACLRTKMVEVSSGLPTVDAPTQVAAEPNAGTQQQETAQAEPEEKAAALTAPVLGLVRAEPDGSVVIAGSAVAGRTLEIYAGGKLLGTVTTESSGDWVLVPDERLPIGGVEITVVDTQTNQVSEQSVVVAIAEDRTSEPLVVASTPGQASDILQGLIKPQQVAAVEPAVQPEPEATSAEPEVVEPEVMETAANNANDAVADINQAIESTSQHLQLADAPAMEVPAGQIETAKVDGLDKAIGDVDELEKQVAALEAAIPPTIDAIEIDGDRNFFAGTGQDGATIRVYVDNQSIGDAIVEDGHWLLEVDAVLKQQSQRVRADQLGAGSSEVASRAEVEFIFDLPAEIAPEGASEAEHEIVVAEAEPAAAEPAEIVAKEQVQPETQKAMETAQAEVVIPKPNFGIDTGIPVVVAPEMVKTVEESKPAEMVADAKPDTMPAPKPNPETQIKVAEVAKPDAEPTVPQLVAKSTGEPGQERFVSGRAIIRRGDNLWTIARRVYGDGYRFSAIYQANKGQIRDPDLIYPGQVFELPE